MKQSYKGKGNLKTYTIPHTDIVVSRLAYGTWHLGGSWDSTPLSQDLKDRAARLIHTAVDEGITMIDLADIYTRGKSDEAVGYVLQQTPGLREKLVLQEKAGIILSDDPNPGDIGRYDFSYEHLIHTVERSLKRLNTDYVDVLLLHRPDPLVQPEEVARAFDELQSSGKVRAFGVSNHTPAQIDLLKRYVDQPIVANQLEVNLLHNNLINDGIVMNTNMATYSATHGTLEYCRLHDIQIQAWSPVAGGKLFVPGDDDPQNVHDAAKLIAELAEQHNTTKEAIALAWLLRHPAGILPIIGTLKPERISVSVKADDVELSRMEWYRLLAAANGAGVP